MKKEYKMIAFDMDGTLLNKKKEVTPEIRKAMEDAVAAGKHVVVATGRAINETNEYRDIFPLLSMIVFAGGAVVYDPKKEAVVWTKQIEKSVADEIFDITQSWGVETMYYVLSEGTGITTGKQIKDMAKFNLKDYQNTFQNELVHVEDVLDYYKEESPGLEKINVFLTTGEERRKRTQELRHLPVEIAWSEASVIELTPDGVSKIDGLRVVSEALGVGIDEMIAVGDAQNDLNMIRGVGLGVAMDNAIDEVKDAADYVTSDNEHNGCAEVIYKFLLG